MNMIQIKCIKVSFPSQNVKIKQNLIQIIAGEFFTFKCDTTELEGSKTIDHVDVNWTRVSKFPPFMKMGDKQGYVIYHCTGFKLPQSATVNDLDPLLAKEINERMTSYAAAADDYNPDIKNVSSSTYFRDNFETYKNDPSVVWPLES